MNDFLLSTNPVRDICSSMVISQKDLSKLMGVSNGTVNRWSSNPEDIPLTTLYFMNLIIKNSIMLDELEKYRLISSLLREILIDAK